MHTRVLHRKIKASQRTEPEISGLIIPGSARDLSASIAKIKIYIQNSHHGYFDTCCLIPLAAARVWVGGHAGSNGLMCTRASAHVTSLLSHSELNAEVINVFLYKNPC